MTTTLSDRTITSDELIGAALGLRVSRAPSKYFFISAGSVTTVLLPVPMNNASGALSFVMASTSEAANAATHLSTTAKASSFGPANEVAEKTDSQSNASKVRMSSPLLGCLW